MKQIYIEKTAVTFSTGDSGYIYGERIRPGHVLRVDICCAYAPEREASDDVKIGVENGGDKVLIKAVAPLAAQGGVTSDTPFYVGEGDRAFAYFPDADDTDTLELHIIGQLMTLNDWRKMEV